MTKAGGDRRLLIAANPEATHVGGHFLEAARRLDLGVRLCDIRHAYDGPVWKRKVAWWLRGHRPSRLDQFSAAVVTASREWNAGAVLTTGLAPLSVESLRELGQGGVKRLNFLTDDPWNPAHRAPWFLEALGEYDHVFSPRTANLAELEALGHPLVSYLPFAYAPEQHFVERPATDEERRRYDADLLFAGGADPDRVDAIVPFIEAGFDVSLYGGYWDRYPATRRHGRGHLGPAELRRAVSGAKVCLGLVRRANRDGHSMRSFEVPAMGGCLLLEDTVEHRAIFGADGDAVLYFADSKTAVDKLRGLLADERERQRLAESANALMRASPNTYSDRLQTILQDVWAGR
jgi:hypothetical protein